MGEVLEILWSSHHDYLCEEIWRLLNSDEDGSDVEISCHSSIPFKAHSFILKIFCQALINNNSRRIMFEDEEIKKGDLQCLLEFIYLGKTYVDAKRLTVLRKAAVKLGLDVFVETIDEILKSKVVENEEENTEEGLMSEEIDKSVKKRIASDLPVNDEIESLEDDTEALEDRFNPNKKLKQLDETFSDSGESISQKESKLKSRIPVKEEHETKNVETDEERLNDVAFDENDFCPICDKKFKDKDSYFQHLKSHSEQCVSSQCLHCSYKGIQLEKHMTVVHHLDKDGNSLSKLHACKICDFKSETKFQLTKHEQGNHGTREFKCNYCWFSYNTQWLLDRHLKTNHSVATKSLEITPTTLRVNAGTSIIIPESLKIASEISETTPTILKSPPEILKSALLNSKWSPTISELTPVISKSAPVISKSAPVISKSAPVIAKSAPVIAKSAPVISKSIPEISKSTPAVSKSTPEISKSTPTISKSSPTISNATPQRISKPTPTISMIAPGISLVKSKNSKPSLRISTATPRISVIAPGISLVSSRISKKTPGSSNAIPEIEELNSEILEGSFEIKEGGSEMLEASYKTLDERLKISEGGSEISKQEFENSKVSPAILKVIPKISNATPETSIVTLEISLLTSEISKSTPETSKPTLDGAEDISQIFVVGPEMMEVVSEVIEVDSETSNVNPRPFKCDICGECYKTASYLKSHTEIHFDKVVCEICGACLAFKSLQKHKKMVHCEDTKREKYQCELCSVTFSASEYLKNHMKKVHTDKRFKCHICGTLFKTPWGVTSHAEVHLEKVNCGLCGKLLTQRSLRSHMNLIHGISKDTGVPHATKPKIFKCNICPFTSRIESLLRRHVKDVHPENRNFACQVCGLRFKNKKGLDCHSNVHLSRILCMFCGKSLSQRCLPSHLKIFHEGVKHTRSTPLRTVKCPLSNCDFKSNYRSNLKKHLKLRHRLEAEKAHSLWKNALGESTSSETVNDDVSTEKSSEEFDVSQD